MVEQATNVTDIAEQAEPVFIRYDKVLKIIGVPVHKTTLRRWENQNRFPKRIKLGSKTVVWDRNQVQKWRDAKREAGQ